MLAEEDWAGCSDAKGISARGISEFAESHLEMGQLPCGSGRALWSPYFVGAK